MHEISQARVRSAFLFLSLVKSYLDRNFVLSELTVRVIGTNDGIISCARVKRLASACNVVSDQSRFRSCCLPLFFPVHDLRTNLSVLINFTWGIIFFTVCLASILKGEVPKPPTLLKLSTRRYRKAKIKGCKDIDYWLSSSCWTDFRTTGVVEKSCKSLEPGSPKGECNALLRPLRRIPSQWRKTKYPIRVCHYGV